jgi:hypothetical protein
MDRFMSGSQFGAKAGLRVGIFLALTLGFPFIVYGLVLATNARSVGGAAGALAVVAGIYLKPIIILGFLISLFSPCWRRMRSFGLPGLVGLLVPFLVLMDAMYFFGCGSALGCRLFARHLESQRTAIRHDGLGVADCNECGVVAAG